MEKYTIDIDKVLDEFEETEALNIHSEKKLAFDLDHPHSSNGLSLGAALSSHGLKDVIESFDNATNISPEYNASGLDDIQHSENLISSVSDTSKPEKQLSHNVSESLNNSVLCADITSKNLRYDIFYKTQDSISNVVGKSTIQSANGKLPEDATQQYSLCDSSPDEILCVSVLEDVNTQSHSNNAQNLMSQNISSECILCEDYNMSEVIKNSGLSLSLDENVDSKMKSESPENVEVSSDAKSTVLNQGSSLPLKENSIYSEATDDNSLLSKPKFVEYSHTKSNVKSKEASDSVPCVLEQETNYSKRTWNSSNEEHEMDMASIPVEDAVLVEKSLENKYDDSGQDIPNGPASEINGMNNFGVQDDDSGVSSTEDISGNSPTEMLNNESSKQTSSDKCDGDNSLGVEHEQIVGSHISKNDLLDQSKTSGLVIPGVSESDNKASSRDISMMDQCLQITDSTSFVIASSVVQATPDLDSKPVLEENSDSIPSKEILIKSEESESLTSDVASNRHLNITMTANDSFSQKAITAEVHHYKGENSFVSDEGNDVEGIAVIEEPRDDFSPRLQRPTTLDLPSLQIVSSDVPENMSAPNMDQSLMDVSLQQNLAEYIPCPKQTQVGIVKPYWIPDSEATNCMHCGMKFTVLKRRHHCRGCGKVLCSRCCNQKAYLHYLNKEDRICQPCAEILSSNLPSDQMSVPFDNQSSSSCGSSPNFSPTPQIPSSNFDDKNAWRPHPNNPDDYCSTIPPLQQIQSSGQMPPPTVMVPIGVLKRGNKPRREPKQVIFSDGIRPGGDLTDLTEPTETVPVYRRIGDSKHGSIISPSALHPRNKQKRLIISDGEGQLPPLLPPTGNGNDDKMDWNQIFEMIQDDEKKPVSFALTKNMHLFVKLTKLDCCFGSECWCFTSCGLSSVGQDEVMVILKRLPGEKDIPRDILKLFSHICDSASKGSTFDDLGHIIFPEQILGSSDHRGFLFVRPTFQCLSKLTVPNTPYLVAILIHKWEVPWAKVFPLRLMLRLGAECRYYPCALVSIRHRKPVYFEIGQTIMSVLSDLRNYQFTIPVIPGLVVHMEEKKTCVNIPRNRYEKVIKILNSNNVEHVLALGSNFSTEADSHLVCMQKEEGDYQTQAINIENTTRRVTGASFIVFSGALKSASGLSAKFSIVEDGLLIQIPQETMIALHMALRDMRDLTIECGQINAAEPEEVVLIQWTRDDKKFNIGVRSPIDNKSFEGVPNLRIHTSTDYAGDNFLIRWTEVFFLDVDENGSSIQNELVDPCRLAETVAQSCCMALAPFLDQLAESDLIKLGLRVTLDSQRDRVEYDVGARGKALPAIYMNALDNGLIPVLLRLSGSTQSEKLSFELIFHILIK